MNEPRWTPGPWLFQPIADHHRGWVKSVCKGWPERIVARPEGQETADERKANAHLIAAAPELYRALEELLAASLTETLLKESAGRRAFARDAARAALAKARAEQ